MSNSVSDDNKRPTLTRDKAQSDADTAIAAFVSELQQGWDQRDAAISNRHFAADMALGSPYGATVHGYDQLHTIHTRLKQQSTGGVASRYALNPQGQPVEPTSDTTGAFSEMALYVLVR